MCCWFKRFMVVGLSPWSEGANTTSLFWGSFGFSYVKNEGEFALAILNASHIIWGSENRKGKFAKREYWENSKSKHSTLQLGWGSQINLSSLPALFTKKEMKSPSLDIEEIIVLIMVSKISMLVSSPFLLSASYMSKWVHIVLWQILACDCAQWTLCLKEVEWDMEDVVVAGCYHSILHLSYL